MSWLDPSLWRSLAGDVPGLVGDLLVQLPGWLLAYVILITAAGEAGRLLRRHGRLGSTMAMYGVLFAAFSLVYAAVAVRLAHITIALYQGWFARLYQAARHGLPSHPALERNWSDLAAMRTWLGG